jgi:hypothetical protein
MAIVQCVNCPNTVNRGVIVHFYDANCFKPSTLGGIRAIQRKGEHANTKRINEVEADYWSVLSFHCRLCLSHLSGESTIPGFIPKTILSLAYTMPTVTTSTFNVSGELS